MAKKRSGYWYENEEKAVVDYLITDSEEEKDKIYLEKLKYPLHKMIESIIRRYKLYNKEMNEDDLQTDTLSFLVTKFDKFDVTKGFKSYSYFGTICKNYLRSQLIKSDKNTIRNVPYQDISSTIESDPSLTYELEFEPPLETFDFIKKVIKQIKDEIDNNGNLKINELKVGYAVIDILNNWETIFSISDYCKGSNIYAKNKVLHILREMTFLNSKEIRNSLKVYKVIYEILKKEIYEEKD